MLHIDLKPGERVKIGGEATITLEKKSGQVARLSIEADKNVSIQRINSASPAAIAAQNGLSGIKF